MNYPDNENEFREIIVKISQNICVDISNKLEVEHILTDCIKPDAEFDQIYGRMVLSETDSEFD